jgi:hypothetical protein
MLDETTTLAVTCYGVTHAVVSSEAMTATDFVRTAVSLMKSQGYILSNIVEALDEIGCEVQDEIQVLTR